MRVPKGQQRPFEILSKNKNWLINVCVNEIETLKSVKIQFVLLVRFSMIRDEEVQKMEHYFDRMQPIILNENNIGTFIAQVKGGIDA